MLNPYKRKHFKFPTNPWSDNIFFIAIYVYLGRKEDACQHAKMTCNEPSFGNLSWDQPAWTPLGQRFCLLESKTVSTSINTLTYLNYVHKTNYTLQYPELFLGITSCRNCGFDVVFLAWAWISTESCNK